MKRSAEMRDLFMPWAGLVVGIVGTGFAHQYGSESVFNDCSVASPIPVLIVCLIGIAATVIAALASWRVVNDANAGPARKLAAVISVGSAPLFVMAMLLPVIAALMLPPCFQ